MIPTIPLDVLNHLWPHGDSQVGGLRAGIAEHAPEVHAKYGITSLDVVAIMMGQFSLECGGGTEMVENLNYSAGRIQQVWPSRPGAVRFAHDPKGLADAVYNGRMGNRTGTDDGWNFRGRGLPQTTGREEYVKVGSYVGLDLLNTPALVNDPKFAYLVAVANFIKCGCLPYALQGDINSVTKHLNGGYTGLADRKVWTARWRANLKGAPMLDSPLVPAPVLPVTPFAPKPHEVVPNPRSVDPPRPGSGGTVPPRPENDTLLSWLVRKFF